MLCSLTGVIGPRMQAPLVHSNLQVSESVWELRVSEL